MDSKVAVILYKSKVLKNGEHPIMVRVNKKGRKYVSLGISCPASLWDNKKNIPKRTHPNRDFIKALISQKVLAYQNKLVEDPQLGNSAEKIIQAVENTKTNQQFFPFLSELIDRLVQSGKIGNANVYKDTRRTLKNFTASSTILLTDIDQSFLSKYEAYLRGLGLADTSSSAYFRTLRAKTGKMIQFKLLAPARAIIEYYRPDTLCRQEDYILPILNKNVPITPTQIDHRLEKVLKSEVL